MLLRRFQCVAADVLCLIWHQGMRCHRGQSTFGCICNEFFDDITGVWYGLTYFGDKPFGNLVYMRQN